MQSQANSFDLYDAHVQALARELTMGFPEEHLELQESLEWLGLDVYDAPEQSSPEQSSEETKIYLGRLIHCLSQGIASTLAREDFVDRLVLAYDLKKDNLLLSEQVRQLKAENEALKTLLVRHHKQYHNLIGNLYLKREFS